MILFMVWKLQPEQKFKVKSWLIQKSRADHLRTQRAIQILRPRCTIRHHGYLLWQVSKNSNGNCRRSCTHKKLLMNGICPSVCPYKADIVRLGKSTFILYGVEDEQGYNMTLQVYKKGKMLVTKMF